MWVGVEPGSLECWASIPVPFIGIHLLTQVAASCSLLDAGEGTRRLEALATGYQDSVRERTHAGGRGCLVEENSPWRH